MSDVSQSQSRMTTENKVAGAAIAYGQGCRAIIGDAPCTQEAEGHSGGEKLCEKPHAAQVRAAEQGLESALSAREAASKFIKLLYPWNPQTSFKRRRAPARRGQNRRNVRAA